MIREDVLPPVLSAKFICEHSHYVKIHQEGIEILCKEILSSLIDNKLQLPETDADSIHPDREHPRAVDWVFVADALNFCFWSRSKEEQWTVNGYTGYYALEAALHRALKEGYDITNPEYYYNIKEKELKHIFRGDTSAEIPLFSQRIAILHEVGTILIEKYNKTFETCVKEANKSAIKLLEIVVENFPCFRDEALYQGSKVSFYKRAQILVADLWNVLENNGCGEFHDIDKLTMFADYRVPQVLVYFGAMSYSDELMDKLKKDILLPSGSQEEVEIRGCSIHTIELLKQSLQESITRDNINIEVPNSSLLDYYLWCYRRKHAKEMEKIPYHKTLGIYY
ncbi:queuosine salvage protein [Bicyclus anynana]|uniref:Queuosine 5'-phosphate N-glycosylase/hydrolase n=1 Tax=Bicyclus anynana TaxID=110368 RepID=A0A6J1NE07_BICAN|nr:queuosine salvage protein [Bicyclus anynana]